MRSTAAPVPGSPPLGGRIPRRTVALLALSAIVSHSLARSTFPVLLPAIEAELLDSHQQSGALSTINFAAYLLGVAAVTSVSGRLEPTRLLYGGLAFAATGFALLSQANGFALLAAGLALAGAGSAGIWMSVPVIATSVVGPNQRGMMMGLLSSTMGIGIIAASQGTNLVRSVQADDGAWRPVWWAAALFTVALALAMAILLRLPPTTSVAGGVSLRRLRAVPGWVPLTAGYLLFGLAISGFTPFFGVALEEAGFSRTHVANLYSLFGLSAALVAVNLGRISDRVGRRPVLFGALMVLAGASLLVLTGREPWATVAAVLFGGGSFTFPVLIAAYLSDHLSGRALSNALGAITLLYGVALTIGPFLSGTLGDSRYGFDAVFVTVAAACAGGALFIRRLPQPT